MAVVALDATRAQLLATLVEPASAAALAAKLGITRQKVNYHLTALESHGLVSLVSERKWGGITERVMQATAASFVVSPAAVDAKATEPALVADRLSAGYMIALAGRAIREIGSLAERAAAAGHRLPTLSIDTAIGFRSPQDRAAFAAELTDTIAALAARYHHDDGRPHRLVVSAYPRPEDNP